MAKRKRQVQIQVDVQTAKAIRALRRFGGTQDRTFRSMRRALDKTLGKWKKQKDAIVTLDASINLLGRAFQGLSTVLETTITASAQQQSGINQLNRSFDQLGLNVPEATSALEAFAAQQQRTTRFGDDQTRAIAANLGQLLTGTETTADEIIALTALVQDTVEATGKGAEEVARQLAQVYSGNVEAIGELIPAQREAINAIKETDGAAAAAAASFELLNTTFGGAASAIDPFEQQVANLQNTFGDLLESIGDQARRHLEESGALGQIQETLEDIIYWVETNGDQINNWIDEFSGAFRAVYDAVRFVLGAFDDFVEARARFRAEEAHAAESDALFQREQANLNERIELEGRLGAARNSNLEVMEEAVRVSRLAPNLYVRLNEAVQAAGFQTRAELEDYGRAIRNAAAMSSTSVDETIERIMHLREVQAQLRVERQALSDRLVTPEEVIEFEGMDFTAGGGGGGGGGGGIDPDVFEDIEEDTRQSGFVSAYEYWQGFVEGFGPALDEALEQIDAIRESGREIWKSKRDESRIAVEEDAELAAVAWIDGMSTAENAVRNFTSIVPRLMEDGAQGGAAKLAAVFELMGAAAAVAAEVGTTAGAASAWTGVGQFFALAAAAATFAAALGAGGGGGGAPARREAEAIDAGDVLAGTRPEAARMGQPRVINMQVGAILDNTDSRRQVRDWIREMSDLNELPGGMRGG